MPGRKARARRPSRRRGSYPFGGQGSASPRTPSAFLRCSCQRRTRRWCGVRKLPNGSAGPARREPGRSRVSTRGYSGRALPSRSRYECRRRPAALGGGSVAQAPAAAYTLRPRPPAMQNRLEAASRSPLATPRPAASPALRDGLSRRRPLKDCLDYFLEKPRVRREDGLSDRLS